MFNVAVPALMKEKTWVVLPQMRLREDFISVKIELCLPEINYTFPLFLTSFRI